MGSHFYSKGDFSWEETHIHTNILLLYYKDIENDKYGQKKIKIKEGEITFLLSKLFMYFIICTFIKGIINLYNFLRVTF